jgi:hypothetical protein
VVAIQVMSKVAELSVHVIYGRLRSGDVRTCKLG